MQSFHQWSFVPGAPPRCEQRPANPTGVAQYPEQFSSHTFSGVKCLGLIHWVFIYTCLMANRQPPSTHPSVLLLKLVFIRICLNFFWLFACKEKHVNVNEQTTNNLAVWGASTLPIFLSSFQLSVKSHHAQHDNLDNKSSFAPNVPKSEMRV